MKSKNPPKRYAIHQSPLFRIRGHGQFEKRLGIEWDAVDRLTAPENYRVWIDSSNGKEREIQQPIAWLGKIHEHIGGLIRKIEVPEYLFSTKGRSSIENARQHLGDVPLIKTDIHKFYPSITRQMVFRMFVRDFQCAADVSSRLADICCYQQRHLPTGSALSGGVAFFAARHMFDELFALAQSQQCKMTVYVDDVTVSGPGATKTLLAEFRHVVRKHEHKSKSKKSKTYSAFSAKEVTGAVIDGSRLRVPNKQSQKIWIAQRKLLTATAEEKPILQRSLRGRLQQTRQILEATDQKAFRKV
jgi:hypothetical protein